MKKVGVFLVVLVVFVLSACSGPNNGQLMSECGLLGEHLVSKMPQEGGEGNFFSGSVSDDMDTKISFSWSPGPNKYLISSVPRSKVLTIVDEKREKPVVVFSFDEYWLASEADHFISKNEISNVNRVVESDKVLQVIVYINSEDLSKERFLPQ